MQLIFLFNSASNKSFARRIQKQIYEEIRVLTNFPDLAPIEPLLQHEVETYRSLVVADGRYKVVYVIKEEHIFIHLVFDCRRNTDNIR